MKVEEHAFQFYHIDLIVCDSSFLCTTLFLGELVAYIYIITVCCTYAGITKMNIKLLYRNNTKL